MSGLKRSIISHGHYFVDDGDIYVYLGKDDSIMDIPVPYLIVSWVLVLKHT